MPQPARKAELVRLEENAQRSKNWQRWGPYLSERQWGTVREDYSPDGESWGYFPHDHAMSRAYRWGEDGLLGICDRQCRLCFGLALWNTQDPMLKERLFGLTGPQGNHGEDVKEYYYYLDSTPTHSYMRALYKYPQSEFPYRMLVEENQKRSRSDREFELLDTGVFNDERYFDVFAEYAKASPDDILIRITLANRGPQDAELHVLPTAWFRNTWIWGCRHEGCSLKPRIESTGPAELRATHETLGEYQFVFGSASDGTPCELLVSENETNSEHLFGVEQYTPYVKDAFHRYVIDGQQNAVSPKMVGTKAAAHYQLAIPAGHTVTLDARLFHRDERPATKLGMGFEEVFTARRGEAEDFYHDTIPGATTNDQRQIMERSYAGLLWTKQFYHYIVKDWLEGDRDVATPPASRLRGRNGDWRHVYARDVISMPDKWEYPWFAAWDLAFHMLPMARIDPDFSKRQLLLLLTSPTMRTL